MPTHASDIEPARPETTKEPAPPRGKEAKGAPGTIYGGSTRVNIAWPFSKINVQDPSNELRDLAVLVADLVTAVEAMAGGQAAGQLEDLRRRSEELAARLA